MMQRPTRAELPTIELRLPDDRAAVPVARNSVRTIVAYAASGLEERVALAVSELATNAVVHTGEVFTLRASCDGDRLLIEVADADPDPPRQLPVSELDQSGRGIALVAAVADHWGMATDGHGKTVWATFDAPETPAPLPL